MCTHEVYCLFTEARHNTCLKGDVNQGMKLAYLEKELQVLPIGVKPTKNLLINI